MSFFRNWFAEKTTNPTSLDKTEVKSEQKNDGAKKVAVRPTDKLPKNCGQDPLKEIANNVTDNQNIIDFALACRGFYHATQSVLNERKLAHHVILAPTKTNKATVLAMLDADPKLLFTKIKLCEDKSGRVFKNKTVFQLARGAGDDDYCLALKSAFIKYYQGDEKAAIAEMTKQRQEMFESDKEEMDKEAACKAHLEEILKPVVAAIDAEQFNHGKDDKNRLILSQKTLDAIMRFREEYAKIRFKVIDGMHFRYNTLSEVFTEHARVAAGWGYNYNKCVLFEDGVLSTIESDLPVNDAQKAAQGLYYLQEEDKPESCNRSVALREGGKNFYEVVRGPSLVFVLSGCYVDISYGHAAVYGSRELEAGRRDYQILCQTKTSNLRSLCSLLNPEPKSQLVETYR